MIIKYKYFNYIENHICHSERSEESQLSLTSRFAVLSNSKNFYELTDASLRSA